MTDKEAAAKRIAKAEHARKLRSQNCKCYQFV